MTADGFEDNKITPQGLKDYEIPPPLTIPSVGAEPESNLPDSSYGEDEDHEEVLNADIEHPPDEVLEWEDLEIDRSYDDELCECKLKALYDHGWFIGKIKYYNEIWANTELSIPMGLKTMKCFKILTVLKPFWLTDVTYSIFVIFLGWLFSLALA